MKQICNKKILELWYNKTKKNLNFCLISITKLYNISTPVYIFISIFSMIMIPSKK
jgi:hypothetical protein